MARVNSKTRRRIKETVERESTPARAPVEQSQPRAAAGTPPVEGRRLLYGAAGVFLVSLCLYLWTLAPTVTLVDSGELIVAARSLGVAHPPGFPLYVLLAHLATLVPVGNVAVRVNFASALFAAASTAMLTLAVAELLMSASYVAALRARAHVKTARKNKRTFTERESAETHDVSVSNSLLVLMPALMCGLLMAFSRTLWAYATIAEVYTLNTLLILVIFFLMLRWRRRIIEDKSRTSTGAHSAHRSPVVHDHDALLYAAAVAFGLALGVHHVTVALVLPALGVLVYRTEGMRFFKSKRLLYAALCSAAALLVVYSYLPVAASRAPVMNWGNPRSLERIWWHITGRQYQAFLTFSPEVVGAQLIEFGHIVGREFGRWWLPLALALALTGYIAAFKRDRTTFWFLALVVVCDMAYALNYDIAEDKDAYYLPTFIALVMAAGFGVRWLIQLAGSRPALAQRLHALAVLPVLLVPLLALAFNLPFNNRSSYFIAHDYVENILSPIEPGGLLLTLDWQVVSPMLYTREVEQRRVDVKVVDVNLLRRSWYFDYLRRAYPALIERSHDQVDAFVADLKQWEHDPQAYASNAALARRIDSKFQEMIRSFVTNQITDAPVYVTSELVLMTEGQDAALTAWLSQNYQLVPQGLVFRLSADRAFLDSPNVHLETRGLMDGTLRFEDDDVVRLKVLPVYKTMLFNRGRYLAAYGQHERAIDAFQQALALDARLDAARQGLNESMNKLREAGASGPK